MSGDVMVLEIVSNKGKLILKNPILLKEPYFEEIRDQYGITECKPLVKSRYAEEKEPSWFDREFGSMKTYNLGHLIISQNNIALLIPSSDYYMQWEGTRGYAAYMENTDIVIWLKNATGITKSDLHLEKHQALVWDFPL